MNRYPLLAILPAILLPVHAQQTAQSVRLEPIVVEVAAGGNQGYTTRSSQAATGWPLALRELPHSVSVITAEQMQEQNLRRLDQSLRQATGVSQQIYGSGQGGYNFLFARGEKIQNIQLDGVPVNSLFTDSGNLGSIAYERVEVVRGVSGLLDSGGAPGASVNLVRKQPEATPHLALGANLAHPLGIGIQGDVGGAIDRDGKLRGRIVFAAEQGDSWRKREESRQASLYATLHYDLGDATTLRTGLSVDEGKVKAGGSHSFLTYDSTGQPTPLGVKDNPVSNATYSHTTTANFFIGGKHHINPDWNVDIEYNHSRQRWDHPYAIAGILGIEPDGSADIIPGYWRATPQGHSARLAINGRYPILGREHELTIAADMHSQKSDRHGARTLDTIPNLYAFSHSGDYPQPDAFRIPIRQHSKQQQWGGYAATRLHINDDLSVILGGRYSSQRQTGNSGRISHARFTPYTAVVYDFTPQLTAYTAYSSLFIPQSQKEQDGAYLKPASGDNLEIGLKSELADGKLNAGAALYQSRKQHLAVLAGQHPDGERYYRAADHTRTRGIDIELGGEPAPGWQIQSGYSYTDSRDQSGKRLNPDTVPRHSAKLFARYRLHDGQSPWTLGAGIRWQSDTRLEQVLGKTRDAASKARALEQSRQKSYAVVDLMASYRPDEQTTLSLNLNNLFNTRYRTQPDRHSYGAPRSISIGINYKFK